MQDKIHASDKNFFMFFSIFLSKLMEGESNGTHCMALVYALLGSISLNRDNYSSESRGALISIMRLGNLPQKDRIVKNERINHLVGYGNN